MPETIRDNPMINNPHRARRARAQARALLLVVPALCLPLDALAETPSPASPDSGTAATQAPATARPDSLQSLTTDQVALDIRRYQSRIAEIERREGAYSPNMAEHLLGLGSALQQAGLHAEAISVFKRGVHLSRINDGLYGGDQVPLLQSEIRSHIALGNFSAADERQVYLYRVQLRTLSSGPRRAQALIQQANWQQQAYKLELGDQGFNRLMSMWELNRLALGDIIEREGETSAALLPPLFGMLRAQYLISDYQTQSSSADYDFSERTSQNRFNAYRAQSFDKGLAVLRAIADIESSDPDADPVSVAKGYVRMADWMLWHGDDDEAMDLYRQAHEELQALDDAQEKAQALLGQPVALPALDGVETLPATVPEAQGNALLEFDVTATGRPVDLERLDDYEDNDAVVNRLMRKLRKTQFRPRFDGGKPVETNNVVWAYDTTRW